MKNIFLQEKETGFILFGWGLKNNNLLRHALH